MSKTHRQPHYLIDDFGDGWFKCRATGGIGKCDSMIAVGPFVANVNAVYYIKNDAVSEFKQMRRNFEDSEANCNTCNRFKRIKHERDLGGFLRGSCDSGVASTQKYRIDGDTFWIHPEDPMNMSCYEPRKRKDDLK